MTSTNSDDAYQYNIHMYMYVNVSPIFTTVINKLRGVCTSQQQTK